jgi:Flp pilus assembly CpaE family ATPase
MSNLQSIYRYSDDPQAEPRVAGSGDAVNSGDGVNSDSSSSLGDPYSNSPGGDPLSIALIGPDEGRRQKAVSALAECQSVEIREFPAYPESFDEVPRLLEQDYDVVIIDLDSNPEYALELVESICVNSPATVMVYSMQGSPELLVRCMRAGAREFFPLPFTHSIMVEALARAAVRRPATRLRKKSMGKLMVFLGAKGGDGVTTLACNFAVALAQESRQSTLLIDLDLPLGDAALNLGITSEYSTLNALQNSDRLDLNFFSKLLVKHSSGLFVLAAPGKFPQFQASHEAVDRLLEVARQGFDNIVVDIGSRLDLLDTSLFRKGSTVYLVVQTSIAGLRNSNRLISQLFSGSVPKLEIVLNRFELRSLGVSEDQISKALTRPAQWKIPNDYAAVRRMQHTAIPLALEDSPISRLVRRMARTACGLPATPQKKSIGFSLRSLWPGLAGKSSTSKTNTPALQQGPAAPAGSSSGQNGASAAPVAAQLGSSANISASSPRTLLVGSLPKAETPAPRTSAGSVVLTDLAACAESVEAKRAALQLVDASSQQDEQDESEMRFGGVAAPVKQAESEWRPRKLQPHAVNKEAPVVLWTVPDAIPYNDAFSAAQLNASASVPGVFAYVPDAGEQLAAGKHTLSIAFTPDETPRYAVAQAEAAIDVAKETPTILWPAPDAISYGDALSAAQLNASASVPGVFTYAPDAGEQLAPGKHTLSVTFTPDETARYAVAQAEVAIDVAKETPTILWPAPDAIAYGDALSDVQLNASASVPGVFSYIPSVGSMLAAGMHTLSVIFTPEDTANYTTAQAAVSLTVAKATPAIIWLTPATIPYGTALGEAELNATASVPGKFVYTPAAGTVLAAGAHALSVVFTPADTTDYVEVRATVSLTVTEAQPIAIAWPIPASIPYGTALSEAELNATASVPGAFSYTPAAGEMLAAGRHTLAVTFTPEDANFPAAQASVLLTVTKAQPVITWPAPDPISYGTELTDAQLNAAASIPGSFIYAPAAGVAIEAGKHTLSAIFTPEESANYAEGQATASLTVSKATPVITWPAPDPISYGTALGEAQLNATSLIPGAFVYSPAAGTVLAAGKQRLSVTFIPADSTDYATAEASVPLMVEGLPNLASLMPAAADAEVETEVCHVEQARGAGFAETERWKLENYGAFNSPQGKAETHTYKGAAYVRGGDG